MAAEIDEIAVVYIDSTVFSDFGPTVQQTPMHLQIRLMHLILAVL